MKSLVFTVVVGFVLLAAVSGKTKSEPQNGQLSIQRTSHGNLTLLRKNIIQKQKHPESRAIMILEERKVNYNETVRKPIKRSVELYAEIGSEDVFTPPPQTTSPPEGSEYEFTTPKGSGDIPTSSVEPKPTTITTTIAPLSGKPKSEPQNGQLSIQRTSIGNLTLFQKDTMQKQKHPERRAIMIFEERKVNYNEILQRKPIKKRSVELYAEIGSGDIFTTQSPETTSPPEGSGDWFTTPEGSGDIPTSSVEPKPTTISTTIAPLQCQNGGLFNGKRCVCAGIFFGDRCEFISGRIELGPKTNVTVNVELRFVNEIYNGNFQDISSRDYGEFETNFKNEMALVYRNISGYKDVEILNIRNGSVIVNHNVIVEVEYMFAVDLNETYNTVFHGVETQLENLQIDICTSGSYPLCINGTNYTIRRVPVPTLEELCREIIPDSFENFYSPSLTHTGVTCLSDCEAQSPNHRDCNDGVCLILPNTGARCSCPDTDQYIYTSGDCNGKMSKSALFGGLGAAIGVLVISLLIVGFIQLKKWRTNKWKVSRDEFLPNTDDIWGDGEYSINFTGYQNDQQDRDSSNNGSVIENFRAVLDNVNSSVEIKTKRPSISLV